MGTTDDGPGRSPTATSKPGWRMHAAAHSSTTSGDDRRRINHMPGACSERAEAISAGRHEMLTDTLRKQIKSLAERGAAART